MKWKPSDYVLAVLQIAAVAVALVVIRDGIDRLGAWRP